MVLDHNGHKLALNQHNWSVAELDLNEHECWITMKACHSAGSQWPKLEVNHKNGL